MKLTPYPTQLSGANFLANNRYALLADEPRVGKTGAAIIACDYNLHEKVLVVTTASGRAVWRRAFAEWSAFNLQTQVLSGEAELSGSVPRVIVSWSGAAQPKTAVQLLKRKWDRVILDESHFAKVFSAKRTQAVFGSLAEGGALIGDKSVAASASGVWCLSGTPMPNSPFDLYPMMRALCPERLKSAHSKGWPDVTDEADFQRRYCIVRMKQLPRGFRKIPVIIGGRNQEELAARLEGFVLRRTQKQVGIKEPIFETLPLISKFSDSDLDQSQYEIYEAALNGATKDLETELGPLRRHTGSIKAKAVVELVHEELESGLDKIVLAYWHRETGEILRDGLAKYGLLQVDGSTPARNRETAEQQFLNDPKARVFLGQIVASGEAIDLSSSAELIFVESSFTPKDMKQMALRITNHTQKRRPRVRVAVLQGSIDEAIGEILMRKWTTIKEVLDDR